MGPQTSRDAQQIAAFSDSNEERTNNAAPKDASQKTSQILGLQRGGNRPDDAPAAAAPSRPQAAELPEWCPAIGLDRDVKLFNRADLQAAASAQANDDPPDDFYDFGVEDYARVMQGLSKQKQRAERGLLTAKLREQEEQAMAARFPTTCIRILFPNDDILQMEFSSLETVASLVSNVKKCLHQDYSRSKWYLYTTPPKQVLKDGSISLYRAGLCPAAKIYFGSETNTSSHLKPEIEAQRSKAPETPEVHPKNVGSEVVDPYHASASNENGQNLATSEAKTASGKRLPKWMKPRT